jgi:amino-acid N-acetyltransferase
MEVKKAHMGDVVAISGLVESYAKKGEMLPRPIQHIYASIRDYFVCVRDGAGGGEGEGVIGTSALHVWWEDLGEIRSLAVGKGNLGKGAGSALVNACIDEARALGLRKLFVLTYKPDFFERFGFKVIDKEMLPHKVWGECVDCVKFPNCDETAVIKEL